MFNMFQYLSEVPSFAGLAKREYSFVTMFSLKKAYKASMTLEVN